MDEYQNSFGFDESTFMYFLEPFYQLNIRNFNFNIIDTNNAYDVLFAYSFDNRNYTLFKKQEDYDDIVIDDSISLYVCIWIKQKLNTDNHTIPTNLADKKPSDHKYNGNFAISKNVELKPSELIITDLNYLDKSFTSKDIKFKPIFDLVNEFPKWNFYDNQLVSINRWLEQCNALAEMYGHTVIYFKTEPVEIEEEKQSGIHGIHHVLQNNVIRNVVDIKKIHVMLPNNEIPQDRIIYTDWDMPLQDDFLIHIVRQKFEQAFGLKAVPNEKDYIYFPMLNKLFRVSTMQPKNGFMGIIGWYEIYLAKYEEDSCVRFDDKLKDALSGIPEINGNEKQILADLGDVLADELYSAEKIDSDTVIEERKATENYTNKLEDTTGYVSLKETEKIRESYNNRLEIISINPMMELFPVTVYNCAGVNRREVALRYNLQDYSVKSKFTTTVTKNWRVTFDFVLNGRFNGEIIDILSGNNSVSTIAMHSNKIQLFDTQNQRDYAISEKLEKEELYQIIIERNVILKTYNFKCFKLENREKELVYQNVYKTELSYEPILTNLNLYGGNYMIGNINLYINDKQIFEDTCQPLLNQFRF